MSGRVVVVGNAGLDRRLAVPRLPLAGETLIGTGGEIAPGGKGLNQAVVAARCGGPVRFCAPLGSDAGEADALERMLQAEGLETLLPRLPCPTDFSLLMVLPDGENSIVSTSACSLALDWDRASPALEGIGRGDVLLVQGNLSLDLTERVLRTARAAGATALFNPAPFWPGAERLARHGSLVIANRLEAEALGPALHEAERAIVTRGADGCSLLDGKTTRAFPAQAVTAVDTTGCGDTFCGVLAAVLAGGRTLDDAIAAAQRAAALTATRPGAFAALPTRDELRALLA
ncbi:MAG: PfkB family carbohydrate kinase [Proteobacteria bacterium]|nr:PfkB family carbohydrate kinase [Pseudomonadota bacterium]